MQTGQDFIYQTAYRYLLKVIQNNELGIIPVAVSFATTESDQHKFRNSKFILEKSIFVLPL